MGNYYFKDDKDNLLKVEYTFGLLKQNNELRINLIIHRCHTMVKMKDKSFI